MLNRLRDQRILLAAAMLAAVCVYWPSLSAGWIYDDGDYVLGDPRLLSLQRFWPAHWYDPPPPITHTENGEEFFLTDYEKPLIYDRFLWRFTLALERNIFGASYGPEIAHTVNLLLHLAAVAALYVALKRVQALYAQIRPMLASATPIQSTAPPTGGDPYDGWPALAAFIFAIHPWASEPVCYVVARNGSLGALWSFIGLWCWTWVLDRSGRWPRRAGALLACMFCALLAYASKENFLVAPIAFVAITWPVLWAASKRIGHWKVLTAALLAALVFGGVFWLGIRGSTRASGMLAQVGGGRGWTYFLEVQSPIVLMTLFDHLTCVRVALETNYPGWPVWMLYFAVAAHAVLIPLSLLGGKRWPALLGIAWFYILLAPTNSFLPRPDFLAGRNVYVATAGVSSFLAAALLWGAHQLNMLRLPRLRTGLLCAGAALWLYWGASSWMWASCYASPLRFWQRCVEQAPDHSAMRLNYAATIAHVDELDDETRATLLNEQITAALRAEASPTMRYHPPRAHEVQRAYAFQMLGVFYRAQHRTELAKDCFRQSWTVRPTLGAWVHWIESCAETQDAEQMELAAREAERRWPGQWWTKIIRAMLNEGLSAPSPTATLLREFEAAERAPDAQSPELRMLQVRILTVLSRAATGERAAGLAQRAERLK